jgi:DNA-binding response OmpR family regulator
MRVLVVDDSANAADSLALRLRRDGHQVCTALSASAALEFARAFRPLVILLDIVLPDLDGCELATRLRQEAGADHPLLLVALTGLGQDADRLRSHAGGIDYHLVKPTDPDALLGVIAAFAARLPPAAT